jgi:hypothetical protein
MNSAHVGQNFQGMYGEIGRSRDAEGSAYKYVTANVAVLCGTDDTSRWQDTSYPR